MTDTLWMRRSTRVTASSAMQEVARPSGCFKHCTKRHGRVLQLHDRLPPRHSCDVTLLSFSLWHLRRRSAVGQRPVTTAWVYQRNIFFAKSFDFLFFLDCFSMEHIIFPTQETQGLLVANYLGGGIELRCRNSRNWVHYVFGFQWIYIFLLIRRRIFHVSAGTSTFLRKCHLVAYEAK